MLRLILGIIVFVLFIIICIPMLIILGLVRLFNPLAAEKAMLKYVQGFCMVETFVVGAHVTVIGLENVPADEPVLFVANHLSFFDVLIGITHLTRRTSYIAKKEFQKIPVLGWVMSFLKVLFLDREDIKQGLETIKQAIQFIKDGISVYIFPEGTRNRSGDETQLGEFHAGSFKVAQRTGCKIIPVSFNNTDKLLESTIPHLRGANIIVEYGKPITFNDLSKEEKRHVGEYFQAIIHDMIVKNQALEARE